MGFNGDTGAKEGFLSCGHVGAQVVSTLAESNATIQSYYND